LSLLCLLSLPCPVSLQCLLSLCASRRDAVRQNVRPLGRQPLVEPLVIDEKGYDYD
jgi:hypothetical protein